MNCNALTLRLLTVFFGMFLSINIHSQTYFQQEANYIINVQLNDVNHTLKGFETINYTNNSKDTLALLWLHLWPNAYKNNTTAFAKQKLENGDLDFYYATTEERGYIDSLDFKIDGQQVAWEYQDKHIDICKIILNTPLAPNETITISTPFFVKIPNAKFSRLGHVEQSYMITQWYPKIAVYDENGWNKMPYLNQGEFYSDFGTFDVTITLPENYIVGASGNLQNESEIEYLNKLSEKTKSIVDFDSTMSFPQSSKNTKTLHYIQDNIHDFAWFADKRFHVLKGEVKLPHSNKEVVLWSMFTNNEAKLWKNSIEYMHDAIYLYSLWTGDYLYEQCTAVDGTISAGGGMEYPTITVIGESNIDRMLENVIVHEIGHNWFYGMIANNERTHPWMDEGINSYYEMRYMEKKYPQENMILQATGGKFKKFFDLEDISFKETALQIGMLEDEENQTQAITLPSEQYTESNYGNIVYTKCAIVFDHLSSYLGEDLFDQCMKEYFQKWKFKHPKPNDLQNIFEKNTNKNLSWFFNDIMQTPYEIDYSISGIQINNQSDLKLRIKNKGKIPAPFTISGIKNQEIKNTIWLEGFTGTRYFNYPNQDYDFVQIDSKKNLYEKNRNNNTIRTYGVFKKIERPRLQLIGSLYNSNKTQVFFHPNIKFNYYDKALVGIHFYNQFIPKKGFTYSINSFYGTGSKNILGSMDFGYKKHFANSMIHNLNMGLGITKYSYETQHMSYKRIEPVIEIKLQNHPRSLIKSIIKTSGIYLRKQNQDALFLKSKYILYNMKSLNPYSFHIGLEYGKDLKKINFNTYYDYRLNKKHKLNLKGYIGLLKTTEPQYHLKLSSWSGLDDYMFAYTFFGRSEASGILSNQIINCEGGLKHESDIESDVFISSLNLEFVYSKLLRLYIEGGTNGYQLGYGAGLHISIGRQVSIYIPTYTEKGLIRLKDLNFLRFSVRLNLKDQLKFD